jgi:hypothetical protein
MWGKSKGILNELTVIQGWGPCQPRVSAKSHQRPPGMHSQRGSTAGKGIKNTPPVTPEKPRKDPRRERAGPAVWRTHNFTKDCGSCGLSFKWETHLVSTQKDLMRSFIHSSITQNFCEIVSGILGRLSQNDCHFYY